MSITEAADYFKTTERTVSDWRKRGAPVANVAELTIWLESNLRHTTLDTQAVIDRRRIIEKLGKDFVRSYMDLCKSLTAPLHSDFECVISALLTSLTPQMETLVITLNPALAVDPKEKTVGERIQAEPWPLTGSAENLELEPNPKPRKKKKA